MTHLLDTNAWVAYIRGKDATLLARLKAQASRDLALCSIVLGELYYGAYHSGPANVAGNIALIEQLRQTFSSLAFDDQAAIEYGKIREHLGSLGPPIGPNDMMIAAIAAANNLILVTHNTSEFSRVPNLRLEDWQLP